jgi:hypothetical protein
MVLRMLKTFTVFPYVRMQTGISAHIVADVDVAGSGGFNGASIVDASQWAEATVSSNPTRIDVSNGDFLVLINPTVGLPIISGNAGASAKQCKKTNPQFHSIHTVAH